MIVYKIRSKETGKFRLAGGEPKWNNVGKTFETLGRLRQMISNCMKYNEYHSRSRVRNNFTDWEIIEFEVTELSVKGVHEMVKPEKIVELLQR